MAGLLADSYGWESVFYVMGGLSCIWVFAWWFLVQDNPESQSLISMEEREMITSSLGVNATQTSGKRSTTIPWKAIFTSGPFWAIAIAHVCSNWGWYMLLIELPFYMKQVLKLNIRENAIATAVPFLTMWFFSMVLSRVLDGLRVRGLMSTTRARKWSTMYASFVPMLCLFIVCNIECHRKLTVFLIGVGKINVFMLR